MTEESMRWGIEEDTYIPGFFFQSTKGSLKHKVSLSFDLDHTFAIGNLILFGRKGLDGSTLLALALQNPMADLKKSFCFSIRQYSNEYVFRYQSKIIIRRALGEHQN